MKKIALAGLILVYAQLAAATAPDDKAVTIGTDIGQRMPQFTAPALDLSGAQPKTTEFDSGKVKHVTAYIFVGVTCPATNAYVDRFKQLEQQYGPKGVDFLYIYPNNNDTTDAKLAFHKEKGLGGRLIDDKGAPLARLFKAQRTSELFVANAQGIVVYHGAVDDSRDPTNVKQRFLATALDELLQGKPIEVATTQVFA